MRTDTWKWNDAVITMRPEIGEDDIDNATIANILVTRIMAGTPVDKVPNRVFFRYLDFAKIILQTIRVEGDMGLGVTMPTLFSSDDEIEAFYRALALTPENAAFMAAWRTRIFNLNRAPAQELHRNSGDPLSRSGGGEQSETSSGQSTVASTTSLDTPASSSE